MPKASMPEPPLWTLLELFTWTPDYFHTHGIENARNEAEILLAATLGLRRIDLYLNHDQPLGQDELADFKAVVKRRIAREPVAYITGRRGFWSLDLAVNPAVLIPRPETECLVESVLPFLNAPAGAPKHVLDLGTGSGAIVLALAHAHPEHRYLAMDRSPAALCTARHNARRLGLDHRIDWWCADWDAALSPDRARFDLIVSNPPYVRRGDIAHLQPEVRLHEPRLALDGSDDGLASLRQIIFAAHRYLATGGWLALEMGCDQKADVQAMVDGTGRYDGFRVIQDYSGRDRIVVVTRAP
jgi:release factor glutamine methyltransferase